LVTTKSNIGHGVGPVPTICHPLYLCSLDLCLYLPNFFIHFLFATTLGKRPVHPLSRLHCRSLTKAIEQSHSLEANSFSVSQEILRILQNPNIHYHIHKSLSPVPILSQINLVHAPSHFLKIHFNIVLPYTSGPSKRPLSIIFPHQNPSYTSPLPHTCYVPRPASTHSTFAVIFPSVDEIKMHL
jgi:hypothetical protein